MGANPYVQGWREWDQRYADYVLGKRNWQIAAGCSLLVSLVLAVGIVWLALRSRYVPYVVVADRLGQAITIPLTPASMPVVAARMERWEIEAFIRDARSVSSYPAVEQERLASLHAHARGAADRFLDDYYHSDKFAHDPFEHGGVQDRLIPYREVAAFCNAGFLGKDSEACKAATGLAGSGR